MIKSFQTFFLNSLISFFSLIQSPQKNWEPLLSSRLAYYPPEETGKGFDLESSPLFNALKKTFTKEQLTLVLKEFIFLDIWEGLKDTGKSIVSILKAVKWAICNPRQWISRSASLVTGAAGFIKDVWNKIINMSYKDLLKFAVQIAVFGLSTSLGFQVPDMDIVWFGIGSHRHFLTHSAAPAILFNLTMKLGMRLINRVKENYSGDEDWLDFVQSLIKASQLGFSTGISAHLAKDLFIDGSQTIRGPWSRDSIPEILRTNYRIDDGYLALNLAGSMYQQGRKKAA